MIKLPSGTACQCRRHKRCRFDPWVRKIPWRRAWQPTPVFLPGESQGQRSLVGYSPWSHKESDTTEHCLTLLINVVVYIYNFYIFLISIIKQHTPEYLLVSGLYFLFCLCHTSRGILVIQAGIETRPLRWRRGVLTSGPPGKSLVSSFLRRFPGNNYCFPPHSFPRMLSCLDPVHHQILSILHWTLQSRSQSMQVCIYHLPQLITVSAQGAR